jgi:hypothetical protein
MLSQVWAACFQIHVKYTLIIVSVSNKTITKFRFRNAEFGSEKLPLKCFVVPVNLI